MKNIYKIISTTLVCVLMLVFCSGCDMARQIIQDKSSSELFLEDTAPVVANVIRTKDPNKISEMFRDPSSETLSEIKRFTESCGNIRDVYIDFGGFSYGKSKENSVKQENVRTLSGLITTDTEPYMFIIDYTQYDKDKIYINHLWIITGKTEAVENTNWTEKYHFDRDKEFVFADYYDSSFYGECRLIWGKIIFWNENSAVLDKNDFDEGDINSLGIDGVRAKYGDFGGEYDTGSGYHILFYKSSKEGIYTQLFLNDDDTVREVNETDEIGFGITGIKKIPEE